MRGFPGLLLPLLLSSSGCAPERLDTPREAQAPRDAAVEPADLSMGAAPDLAYACGAYSAYRARTDGIVRSPCDYDVSRVLSIGGDVKTRIRPPVIDMEFPDGTFFSGETDGVTFTATRTQSFPFEDGCTWKATEVLRGTIDVADDCRLRATYSYREAPITMGSCATPCTIDAQVIIDRTRILIE